MAALDLDMQAAFSRGYRGETCLSLFSSTMWECHQLGAEFKRRGYLNRVQEVQRGRASTYRWATQTFQIDYGPNGQWYWKVS